MLKDKHGKAKHVENHSKTSVFNKACIFLISHIETDLYYFNYDYNTYNTTKFKFKFLIDNNLKWKTKTKKMLIKLILNKVQTCQRKILIKHENQVCQ